MYILTKEEMYNADKFTAECIGIKEEILMENAGQNMAQEIVNHIKKEDKIAIFCGNNNNSGDGFVVARKLKNLGYYVYIVFLGEEKKLKSAALLNYSICKNLNITFFSYNEFINKNPYFNVAIDALFGIGFKGELKFPYNEIVKKINKSNSFVISLDIPTGVYADENRTAKDAIKANLTLVVSFFKQSAFLYPSKINYGKIKVVDANIILDNSTLKSATRTWGEKEFKETFIKKEEDTNKSKEGKVLVVGGSDFMPGSISLTANACYKTGAGLVEVATTKETKKILASNILEVTFSKTEEDDGFLKDFEIGEKIDFLVLGPGLARKEFSRNVVKKAILSSCPILLDADALFFLDSELFSLIKKREKPTILTPHEGEMARLCGFKYEEIKNNRFTISKEKAIEWGVYLVLKGPYTIVSTPNGGLFVNTSGNQGLSKGGSGDVLAGIIASFIKKAKDIQHAISNAVYLHGKVCDFLLSQGETENTITPSKLIENIKFVF